MAKREYSNGLQHLKFMQRAKQREEAAKKAEEIATVNDPSQWILPATVGGSKRRCSVIVEGDPRPGALLGRMSFQNCNTSVDKLVEEAESIHQKRFAAAKEKISATYASSRSESVKEEEEVSIASVQDDTTVQFKKPKVGIDELTGWQSQSRGDNKAWQGWRTQGDYRMLRPPPKG
ncbi:hypothetical protein KP509_26G055400 [Ceratopteris richardii]|uniref:Uncharacterized protein n=1 Tax=Ceratopteris richardii TaxID=49495 RepID=A0A8T2RNQ9_CERRI|nr:hypothetical protein KP509_26G055400 [Ceratopteris richardii]